METDAYILVVDDDPDAREILEIVLETLSLRTMYAHDGQEAVIFIKLLSPALVLLDLSMPHLDGREVLKWMRANSKGDIPVLIFTAHHVTPDLLAELGLPENQVIRKGSSMSDLRGKITHFLSAQLTVAK
jgi:two-component system response regulator ResD